MSHDTPGPRRLRDISDGYYRGASFPHPETTPHPYFPERDRANAPPHSMPMAGLPPPRTSCSPQCGAAASYVGVQEQRLGVSYGAWPDAQAAQPENHAPYAPVISAAAPYNGQNQDSGNTNSATVHQYDNGIPACMNPHSQPPNAGFQTGCATESGSALDTARIHSAAGANTQPFVSTSTTSVEAPMRSESMIFFARRYVLDPGTRIDTIHMGPGGYGRLKIIITLEVADGA